MDEHSPGPWRFEKNAIVDARGCDVATMARNGVPLDQVLANARLIAAAPELLAFARMMTADKDGPVRELALKLVSRAEREVTSSASPDVISAVDAASARSPGPPAPRR